MTVTLSTYVVYATHPADNRPEVTSLQVVASSREAAVMRTRMTMLHRTQDVAWMRGLFHVAAEQPGVHMDDELEAMGDQAVQAFVTMVDEAPSLAYRNFEFTPEAQDA